MVGLLKKSMGFKRKKVEERKIEEELNPNLKHKRLTEMSSKRELILRRKKMTESISKQNEIKRINGTIYDVINNYYLSKTNKFLSDYLRPKIYNLLTNNKIKSLNYYSLMEHSIVKLLKKKLEINSILELNHIKNDLSSINQLERILELDKEKGMSNFAKEVYEDIESEIKKIKLGKVTGQQFQKPQK